MGFCLLGGKENYLRKVISDKLTALGEIIGMGASATQYADAIQDIYDSRYTAGQDSLKTDRKLTLPAAATGTNYDIADNWYTRVDASAVYNAGITNGRAAVTSECTEIFTGTLAHSGDSKTITTSRACLIFMRTGSNNVYGVYKRVGTSITEYQKNVTTCSATSTTITISYTISGDAPCSYYIFCID